MKKLIALIALLAVIGFTMAACGEDSSSGAKSITISNLTGAERCLVFLMSNEQSSRIAYGEGVVSRDSVTINLTGNTTERPWTGSGSFYLFLEASRGDEKDYLVYTNGQTTAQLGISASDSNALKFQKTPRYNFSSAASTIDFSRFVTNYIAF
jgi:predicted small secreted protein